MAIHSIDNPGFSIAISLMGTRLETVDFTRIEDDIDTDDHWFTCWKEGGRFLAAGAPSRLEDMIDCFLAWACPGQHPEPQTERETSDRPPPPPPVGTTFE